MVTDAKRLPARFFLSDTGKMPVRDWLDGLIESYVRNAKDREFLELTPLNAGKGTATAAPQRPERQDEQEDREEGSKSTISGLP